MDKHDITTLVLVGINFAIIATIAASPTVAGFALRAATMLPLMWLDVIDLNTATDIDIDLHW
jgi:hypothetical protein